MRNYTLSKEQRTALDMIDSNDLTAVLYLDKLNLATTLLKLTGHNLRNNKRSVLFLESPDLISALHSKVESSSLSHLFLFLDNDDYLKESDLARIRAMVKEKHDDHLKINEVKLKIKSREERIMSVFSGQAEKIFGDRRWKDLVMLPRRTENVLNTLKFQFDLDLNQQEFWHIRGLIEEAKSLFDNSSLLNERIAATFAVSLDSEEKINELRKQLIGIKEKFERILQGMDMEIHNYKNRIHRKVEEEYILICDLIEEGFILLEKIKGTTASPKETGFKFFKKAPGEKEKYIAGYLEIRKKVSESILMHLTNDLNHNSLDDLLRDWEKWKAQLEQWKFNRETITEKMIMSLNKNNSDTGNFKNIDRELTLLYEEVNQMGIFREKLENTSLNTYNQYLSADKYLKQIKLCISYLNENKSIIIWESFYRHLPENIQQLITVLKKHELKEWIPLYEKWYLDKLLEKHFNPDTMIIDRLLKEYASLVNEYNQLQGRFIDANFSPERQLSLEFCKNKNKEIHQKLLKKKNVDDLRVFDLIWSEKQMLTYFFPVMVIPTKLFRSNRLLKSGAWDMVFCEGTEIFQHVEKFTLLEQKVCFLAPLADSFRVCNDLNLKIEDKNQLCKLLIHEYNYEYPIAELTLSDRLKAAKKLSKMLLSLNQQVRIFQMRNANIISLLPTYLNQQLLELYDDDGIKEIEVESSLYETVTESIIGIERQQYILYQDYLISLDHIESFQWQVDVIDAFSRSGFQAVNIKTVDYILDEDYFASMLYENIPHRSEEENTLPKEA